jgi:hypothetical protein
MKSMIMTVEVGILPDSRFQPALSARAKSMLNVRLAED